LTDGGGIWENFGKSDAREMEEATPEYLKGKEQRIIMTVSESDARKASAYHLFISSCYFASIHYTLSRYKNRRKVSWIHGSEGKKTKRNNDDFRILCTKSIRLPFIYLFLLFCFYLLYLVQVQALIDFVEKSNKPGAWAAVGDLKDCAKIVAGEEGTFIRRDVKNGVKWRTGKKGPPRKESKDPPPF
jgi:hypothetical protein